MISLWRVSNHADLEGLGGERAPGRWHTAERAKRIVYLSQNAATALLEVLANLKGNPALFPERYQLLNLKVPSAVSRITLARSRLSSSWRERPEETQALGDAWLAARRSALMIVPSVPAPASLNYLLNPLHPHARLVTIWTAQHIRYDKRLFHVD